MGSECVSKVANVTITEKDDGLRLDRWFKENYPHISFGQLQKLLRTGQVRLNGKRVKTNARIEEGQVVRVPPIGQEVVAAPAKKPKKVNKGDWDYIRSLVIHEDDDLMVLNKPSGLAVQGGTKTAHHVDGMLGALGQGDDRPKLVHRLDRDTSGCLLVAKTRQAASKLGAVFRTRSARKIYWALTYGVPRPHQGEISCFIAKGDGPTQVRPVQGNVGEIVQVVKPGTPGAQHSHSYYSVIEQAGQKLAWVSLKPVTGRTHQLRVHMAELGTPILGDPKYFNLPDFEPIEGLTDRLHLHARRLVIPHPRGGTLDVTAPLPAHMQKSWASLDFDAQRYDVEQEVE
ncbi:MAG: RluA family pseudouridine synthase [Rhizobiales bacterium]|nr:RluA family pseudouridine synthase [Hyphomicrobiales bacterium]